MKAPTIEDKKAYFARTRRSNYVASLRLEGFDVKPADASGEESVSRKALVKRYSSKART